MLSSNLSLDANVFIAALSTNEERHLDARDLLVMIRSREILLHEPILVLSEVASGLYRKKVNQLISDQELSVTMEQFFSIPLLLQWKEGYFEEACKIAASVSSKRIHDYLYLAVASATHSPFVTLDDELRKKGKPFVRQILTPREAVALAS